VAHTLPVPANFTATGCRLGKDGQLMFFNTAGATAPATASKGFMGCDSVIGGGIKPVSASYGGNCVTTILNVLDAEKVTDELKTSTQEPSSYDQLTEEQRKEINQKFVSG